MTKGDGKIQVVLADDHRMLREPLRLLLERGGECEVIGEAASGEEAVALAAKLHPHVIVLDVGMPGMGGVAAAHRIAKTSSASKVLMLSQYDDEEYVIETLTEAGAAGYLLKTDAPEELLNAVRAVHAGKSYLSPSIAPILLSRITRPRTAKHGNKFTLTRREREVLKLVGDGATSKDIALKLDISPKTAQVHRDNLKQKLNLRSTAEMVRYAIKHKIVKLD
jgi:two-component system, NarL family, response regulator NreC